MGSVRPMTPVIELDSEVQDVPRDTWILARSKIKYYGGYHAGFLERARGILCGGREDDPIWHIPGGMAHTYNGACGMPLSGYGPNDVRIDLDPEVEPDILMDVRNLHMIAVHSKTGEVYPPYGSEDTIIYQHDRVWKKPRAIIIDLPYSREEAANYAPGPEAFPSLEETIKQSLRIVSPGGLVGVLDWQWPWGSRMGAKCILCATVTTGEGSRGRLFTVWRLK